MEDEEEGRLARHRSRYFMELWNDKAGVLHRLNGPAMTRFDGAMTWYRHGKRHRNDGPAVVYPIYEDNTELPDVRNEWFKNDMPYEPSAHEIMVWKMKWKEENK